MVEHLNKKSQLICSIIFHYWFKMAVMNQGVYCFHNRKHTYYYFTEEETEKSSNKVGTALFDWILDAKLVDKRPFKELHIWVDNCSGQNKNYYVTCLLTLICQIGLVDRIFLEFLVSNFWQNLLISEILLIISFMGYY